jgi:hypothetical protein
MPRPMRFGAFFWPTGGLNPLRFMSVPSGLRLPDACPYFSFHHLRSFHHFQ